MNSNNQAKQLLVILSQSPYGGTLAREAIDYCLAAAAFEQNIQLLFTGDAVLQLIKDQHPEAIMQKNISKTASALPIYGIEQVYADQSSLDLYNLKPENLCLPVTVVSTRQIADLLANSSSTLNF